MSIQIINDEIILDKEKLSLRAEKIVCVKSLHKVNDKMVIGFRVTDSLKELFKNIEKEMKQKYRRIWNFMIDDVILFKMPFRYKKFELQHPSFSPYEVTVNETYDVYFECTKVWFLNGKYGVTIKAFKILDCRSKQ
jgi:hypothetical protein